VDGRIRFNHPSSTGVRFDHRLKMAKATQVIALIRIDVEGAVRQQTLDHFERLHLLGQTAEATVRTTRGIEPVGEGMAYEYRVRQQS
jgi:hypothetical protein